MVKLWAIGKIDSPFCAKNRKDPEKTGSVSYLFIIISSSSFAISFFSSSISFFVIEIYSSSSSARLLFLGMENNIEPPSQVIKTPKAKYKSPQGVSQSLCKPSN